MEEVWRDIKGYEGLYKVSSTGKVISNHKIHCGKPKEIVQRQNKKGYLHCQLWKNNVPKTKRINRLVAETFIPNPLNKEEVNHKDANKLNNCVENLEWVTREENMKHAQENKLLKSHKWTEENRVFCSLNRVSFIYQLDMLGNVVNIWPNANVAGKALKISASHIAECCRENGKRKSANGFMWRKTGTVTREMLAQVLFNLFGKDDAK